MQRDSVSRTIYTARLDRVRVFTNAHLSEKLSLGLLAKEACFSPYHFHRIFTSLLGETPNAYINRVRLERAANMLQRNPGRSITDIAFTVGFSSSSAFSRSFKQYFGDSPSAWKKRHSSCSTRSPEEDDSPGKAEREQLRNADSELSLRQAVMDHVVVKRLPAVHVAYVASQRGYHTTEVYAAWKTLCQWAGARDLLTPDTVMLGISYDNPEITPSHKCHYYACATVPEAIRPDDTVGMMDLAAGKYAVYHYEGPVEGIQPAFRALYADWLPDSGYQPAHTPCYERYYEDPDTHPEGFYSLDICLPVDPL